MRPAPVVTAAASLGNCSFSRSSSAVWSLFQAATFGERNPGTNVTMTTPPFPGSSCRMSSGTLRGDVVHGARRRVREDHRRVGSRGSRPPSCQARRATRSTSMPSQFISCTTCFAERRQSARRRRVGARVRPRRVLRVRERHVARAERGRTSAARRASCRSSGRLPSR